MYLGTLLQMQTQNMCYDFKMDLFDLHMSALHLFVTLTQYTVTVS